MSWHCVSPQALSRFLLEGRQTRVDIFKSSVHAPGPVSAQDFLGAKLAVLRRPIVTPTNCDRSCLAAPEAAATSSKLNDTHAGSWDVQGRGRLDCLKRMSKRGEGTSGCQLQGMHGSTKSRVNTTQSSHGMGHPPATWPHSGATAPCAGISLMKGRGRGRQGPWLGRALGASQGLPAGCVNDGTHGFLRSPCTCRGPHSQTCVPVEMRAY